MKSYSSREVVTMLKDDGWYEIDCVADHHQCNILPPPMGFLAMRG